MRVESFAYPQLQSLVSALTAVLNQSHVICGRVVVVGRRANDEASTFPSEIVTCRSDGPCEITVFCKYATDHVRNAYGHRGGVDYEAKETLINPKTGAGGVKKGLKMLMYYV